MLVILLASEGSALAQRRQRPPRRQPHPANIKKTPSTPEVDKPGSEGEAQPVAGSFMSTDAIPKKHKNAEKVIVGVIVIIYNPVLTTQGDVRMTDYFKWSNPKNLTNSLVKVLNETSQGFVDYRVRDTIEVNGYPMKRDGFNYDEAAFLKMWNTKGHEGAHQPDSVSYAEIFRRFNLVQRIKNSDVQEIWLWGAPYFGWDEYAMKIPGDKLYFQTDNPWFYRPYDIPDCGKTVWVMGFNYERGLAEAVHSFGHRCEGILSLTVGKGIWDNKRTPDNIWNKFTRTDKDWPGKAECGNVHCPPNGTDGYDYANKTPVKSNANDWITYPKMTGKTTVVQCQTWNGPDYQLNYLEWWLYHLPSAPGAANGYYNNWWKYVVNYDQAVRALPPKGGVLQKAKVGMFANANE